MIETSLMGLLPDGTKVEKYKLTNKSGAYIEVSTLGGCLMTVVVPDKKGQLGDVLLGYNTLEGLQQGGGYMGMLIGRFGNRIGGASFELNAKTYQLAKNNGENHLHGGLKGFDSYVWQAKADGDALVLSMTSPDGDEGYPGALSVTVTYTFSDDNVVGIQYHAVTDQDTILNLTNHAYFNLSGPQCETVLDHEIQINSDAITAVGSGECIPTGKLMLVDETPFDLRKLRKIGEGLSHQAQDEQMTFGNGYDHNFVIRNWDKSLRQAAIVTDRATGRRMETWTDQPGVQFYSGNSISGDTPGKLGVPYQKRQGLCLETQHFPDSIHHPNFPSCVLKKGDVYETRTEYRFMLA